VRDVALCATRYRVPAPTSQEQILGRCLFFPRKMPAESGRHADTRQHAAACALQCEAAGTGCRDCSGCFEVLQVKSFRAMCEMQF
jgi:hypothetical protein